MADRSHGYGTDESSKKEERAMGGDRVGVLLNGLKVFETWDFGTCGFLKKIWGDLGRVF